jgi:hypothetical protein
LRAFAATLAFAGLLAAPSILPAQEPAPLAPDTAPKAAAAIDWSRFDRLAAVAKETPDADRLTEVARTLRSNVPGEAGRMSPLDWYCLGTAWCAYHYPVGKGKPLVRDVSIMEGEQIYAIARKGYRLNAEQAERIHVRLLSMLGVPTEEMTGLVRGSGIDRGSWALCQVGTTWMRVDLARCLPPPEGDWRPAAAYFQSSTDLDGILSFLKAHLPDGDLTARQQGLKQPVALSDWEAWAKWEPRIRERAQQPGADLLFASKSGLFTAKPIGDEDPQITIAPPTPQAISALEQLRSKPYKPTRGEHLAATVRKYVGMPYIWGGENPNSGFDCSGLMQYVCRTWGISIPRTAAEQYHMGRPVSFMDLEPGDLVFLANTYKPGVSHVGMYIGDGLWVNASGTGIGIVEGDVPYFDASGPGARRLNLSHLPRVAGEPAPPALPNRAAVAASRHSAQPRNSAQSRPTAPLASGGPIVAVKICGDTGLLANSGCDTYKTMRMPKSQAKSMRRCYKHRPLGGERR